MPTRVTARYPNGPPGPLFDWDVEQCCVGRDRALGLISIGGGIGRCLGIGVYEQCNNAAMLQDAVGSYK